MCDKYLYKYLYKYLDEKMKNLYNTKRKRKKVYMLVDFDFFLFGDLFDIWTN